MPVSDSGMQGRSAGRSTPSAARREARLAAARSLIASNLSDPKLSPAFAAGRLGVSLRHLHILFAATRMSFSQTVTASRLEQSCRLLLQDRDKPVADVAFACGFDSVATFYRVFRAAYACTPGELRARGLPYHAPRWPRDAAPTGDTAGGMAACDATDIAGTTESGTGTL